MRKSPLAIVFLVIFIDLLGFGILMPLLPLYADYFHAPHSVVGYLVSTYSLMQFFFSPVLGGISDRVGRRPIILVSLLGSALSYTVFGLADSLWLLFTSRIVAGICGASVSTAQAYIADTTKPEERAKGMGLIGAAFGLGFVFGPAIGGMLARYGQSAPPFFAAALSGVAFLLALGFLPESRRSEQSSIDPLLRTSPGLLNLIKGVRHPTIGQLFVVFFLLTFAFSNFETMFSLFCKNRFRFTASQVGYTFAYFGLLSAVVQGGLIRRISKRVGEPRLLMAGSLLMLIAFLMIPATSRVPGLLMVLGVLSCGYGLDNPSITSLISRCSRKDEQGKVLGVAQSFSSMGRILGPAWSGLAAQHFGLTSPFISGGLVMGLATLITIRLLNFGMEGHNP
ncbi:MAG: MFS transporter [Acidobacteria bacterium]|nr:MFS transporter [Acidobacteriota bacterium]MBI3658618.1 MFS transporter [Acidobacteriota bacterium]